MAKAKRAKVSEINLGTPPLVSGKIFDTLGTSLGPRMAEILSTKQLIYFRFLHFGRLFKT
jgi:hypothetical protein